MEINYNNLNRDLTVHFSDYEAITYKDVPKNLYENMLNSNDLNNFIKNNLNSYKKEISQPKVELIFD